MNGSWIAGWVVEVLGIVPAAFVALSYLFTNQRRLRIINTVASVLFILYGILLASTSGWQNGWITAAMNAFCAAIHIVWLIKDSVKRKNYKSAKKMSVDERQEAFNCTGDCNACEYPICEKGINKKDKEANAEKSTDKEGKNED